MRQIYEYHPVLGYRYIPNLRARIPHEGGGYLVQVNDDGFRSNRPFAAAPAPGKRRVLVFGDSFTAGDAVPNHERYTDLLEPVLGAEVYNYGLSSTGTDQQYLAWREFAQHVEHDVVVIAVFVENVRRVVAHYRPHRDASGVERIYAKPYFTLERDTLRLHHVPTPAEPFDQHHMAPAEQATVDAGGRFPLLRKVVTALGAREVVQRLTHYQPLPEYDSPDTDGWRLMRAILSLWVRALERPVVLMPLPLPQHIDEVSGSAGYQARFAELSAELGCTLHDPLPDFLGYAKEQRRRFRWEHDIHFTPEGHRVLTRSLAPVLAQLLGSRPAFKEQA
ncbi:MAG: GDSL-type esterase/lipase family protein [Pseudomonadota bacterium]|nr:GDSL-type esterase/lipase family protein [Pseudomonadota bacterium]